MDEIKITDNDLNTSVRSLALNSELDNAGQAIYQGLGRLYDINTIESKVFTESDIFYFLYQTAIGFERLIKISHKLYKATDPNFLAGGQGHNILGLHSELVQSGKIDTDPAQEHFLDLLSNFLDTSTRYYNLDDRRNDAKRPRDLFLDFINNPEIDIDKIGHTIATILKNYYDLIHDLSSVLNVFTYELRYDSSAAKLFYGSRIYDDVFDIFKYEDRAFGEYMIALISLHKQTDDLSPPGNSLLEINPIDETIYTEVDFFETVRELRRGSVSQDLKDTIDELYKEMTDEDRTTRNRLLRIFDSKPTEGIFRDDYYDCLDK
jgi:hypothetical protein